jgi:hypothetical protein
MCAMPTWRRRLQPALRQHLTPQSTQNSGSPANDGCRGGSPLPQKAPGSPLVLALPVCLVLPASSRCAM